MWTHLITILNDHVGATDEIKIVTGKEVLYDSFPKAVADTSLIVLPI